MKKVIVTGANGFVGSAVCRELSKRGIKVTAVVRSRESSAERLENIQNLSIVYSDLSEIGNLDKVLESRDYDCFYHFAWTGSAGNARGDYGIQLRNIEYSCDAVYTAKRLGCKRFVFAASIMEYEIRKLMETDRKIGINTLYSTSKVTAEYMARAIADNIGIEYVGGIISNIYGPGEYSPRLVNTTIRKLLNGEYCKFSPGEQMYDFIYIEDAARAFCVLGSEAFADRSYYIGSLNPKPLKEFLGEIRDIVSPGTQIGLGDLEFDGVSLTYKEFDIYALKNDTGFEPQVSFESGVEQTAVWIKENQQDNGKF